jgi:hypothetical protein
MAMDAVNDDESRAKILEAGAARCGETVAILNKAVENSRAALGDKHRYTTMAARQTIQLFM